MWKDPIVEELHRIRESNAAKYGYDVHALARHYQDRQKSRLDKVKVPNATTKQVIAELKST